MAEKMPQACIRVLVFRVGKLPQPEIIQNSLDGVRHRIDADMVESFPFEQGLHILCDEDWNRKELPPNRVMGSTIVRGDFLLVRMNSRTGDWIDLTDHDVEFMTEYAKQTWPMVPLPER